MGLEEVVSLWVRISIGISAGEEVEVEVEVDAGRFKFLFQLLVSKISDQAIRLVAVPANLGNLVLG